LFMSKCPYTVEKEIQKYLLIKAVRNTLVDEVDTSYLWIF